MPAKINMFISNGNYKPSITPSLATPQVPTTPKAPSALNAPFIARIHNVRPGCGSCGRH